MSEKIVRARTAGTCSQEFAHPSTISPGDVVMVTTVMPRSELAGMGVKPFTRFRTCSWCLNRQMESRHTRERTHQPLVERWRALTGNPESTEGGN